LRRGGRLVPARRAAAGCACRAATRAARLRRRTSCRPFNSVDAPLVDRFSQSDV